MSDDAQPVPDNAEPVEVEDPEYELEEPILIKRREEVNRKQFAVLLSQNLSELSKTYDGSSYAFIKLSLSNKGLTQLYQAISRYAHLRDIDLSNNLLTNFQQLFKHKYILSLNLSKNQIEDINVLANDELFPFLQLLNLSHNKIRKLSSVYLKRLKRLNLNHNLIEDISDFDGSKTLEILEMRGNQIRDVSTLSHLPKLRELYLADNKLEEVTGLKLMDELVKLHLRKNKISKLEGLPGLPNLKYINLRENSVTKLDQLRPINEKVQILNLIGNPLSEELGDNTRKQVWMLFRQFEKINKQQMTADDKVDFDREYKERLAEKERQRLEKELADKEAAEREAAERQAASS